MIVISTLVIVWMIAGAMATILEGGMVTVVIKIMEEDMRLVATEDGMITTFAT